LDQSAENKAKETNLYEIVDLLWRRKALIAVCLAGVLLPIAVATFTMHPVYEAQTSIIFEQSREPLPSFDFSENIARKTYIVNQIEEIKSRSLSEDVAQRLDTALARELLPEHTRHLPVRSQAGYISGKIKGNISVEPVRESDVLLVKFQGPSPRVAAEVANLVTAMLMDRNASVKREQASSTRKFIEDQLPTVEANLTRAEEALKTFKTQNQVVTLSSEASEILSRITSVDVEYNKAVTESQTLQRRLEAIGEQLRSQGGDTVGAFTSGSLADGLRKSLIDLQMEATQLSVKGYGQDHPQMVRLSSQIASTKEKLNQELQAITSGRTVSPMPQMAGLMAQIPPLQIELATAQARERALRRILDQYEAGMGRLPYKELQLARLERAKEVGENLYKLLLERNEEAKITEAGKLGNLRVIDPAVPPAGPIKPRKALNLAIGLAVGLTLGLALAFFLESLDNSVKTPEELEHNFELPVLGLIPAIQSQDVDRRKRRDGLDEVARISSTLVTRYTPRSPISEAYRALRTNIQFSRIDSPLKTVVITSSAPSEGKSTTVANLAITTALMGVKTLLVDADLRRPVVHSLFGLEREPGMINMLAEKLPLEKVVRPSGIESLDILTCGAIPPNPSELLNTQRMRDLIAALSAKYDLVLFDSPPVLTVTDTCVLGSRVEGVVLVVNSHATDRRALNRAQILLKNVKANVLGAVLNRIEISSLVGSYDYYYYHYYYYFDDEGKKVHRRRRIWDRLKRGRRRS
jgi:tyrosine-protein kinase Etk/Wzc